MSQLLVLTALPCFHTSESESVTAACCVLLQLLGLEVSRAEIADMLSEVDEDGSGEHCC
jgi:hypothetical protein